MDSDVSKLIKKFEKEKQIKTEKRNQLDAEINVINENLKELNSLNNQHQKYMQLKESTIHKLK